MKSFDPNGGTRKTRRNLPHWMQEGCLYFVTFRLADALAQAQLRQWEDERRIWMGFHPQPWDASTWNEYDQRFSQRIDAWLDAGRGSCLLARPEVSEIVVAALRHFDGERYDIDAFVVMPNHVHVLVAPREPWDLRRIEHSWKSFTAKEINRLCGRTGALWLEEGFDHIVRSEAHRDHFRGYIAENPGKAGLRDDQYFLQSATGILPVGISNANHGQGCPWHTAGMPRCHGHPARGGFIQSATGILPVGISDPKSRPGTPVPHRNFQNTGSVSCDIGFHPCNSASS